MKLSFSTKVALPDAPSKFETSQSDLKKKGSDRLTSTKVDLSWKFQVQDPFKLPESLFGRDSPPPPPKHFPLLQQGPWECLPPMFSCLLPTLCWVSSFGYPYCQPWQILKAIQGKGEDEEMSSFLGILLGLSISIWARSQCTSMDMSFFGQNVHVMLVHCERAKILMNKPLWTLVI